MESLKKITIPLSAKEKIKQGPKKGEGVFDEKKFNFKGNFPHTCKKCGCKLADVVDLGAPYSDESNVYLFKCDKCGYVERQADGSSN